MSEKITLLAAFIEEYEWVRDCMAEMQERPEVYNQCDHEGLPYSMMILKNIAENAGVTLPKRERSND